MPYFVNLEKVKKTILKLPKHIKFKLLEWAMSVELDGLEEVRKLKGYHDEPLLGERKGQRSVRLSRSYRAFYTIEKDRQIVVLVVEEVNKHDY